MPRGKVSLHGFHSMLMLTEPPHEYMQPHAAVLGQHRQPCLRVAA